MSIATYDFVGHSAAKTAFTLPQWISNGRGAKNLSFKHEFLQNPLLEYI